MRKPLFLAGTALAAYAFGREYLRKETVRRNLETRPQLSELVLAPGPQASEENDIFFVGNSTVVLRYAGFTILTDPNFLHRGDHVHIGYGLTAQRLTDPAIELDELPPIDLVLLSHMHEDHFDREVQQRLDHGLPIITTPEAARKLAAKGFRSTRSLDPWQSMRVLKGEASLTITAMPGRHGPSGVASFLPEVNGSMLEFQPSGTETTLRMYISGDTLMYDDIVEIPRRFPEIDVALVHLGGTRVLGMMVTMDAAQGVEMLKTVAPDLAIPIHHSDYSVFKSPLEDFQTAVRAAGLQDKVRYLALGERFQLQAPPAWRHAGESMSAGDTGC